MGSVAGVHIELSRAKSQYLFVHDQGQTAFEYVELFAPAFGICLGEVFLSRLQGPFPQLDFAGGGGFGQQDGFAPRLRTRPGHFVDATRVRRARSLNQITEGYVQCLCNSVKGAQADVLFASLYSHQHSPTHTGQFGQGALAQVRQQSEAPYVLTDVLQNRRTL